MIAKLQSDLLHSTSNNKNNKNLRLSLRNLYSGFLLGLLLICSSLFYGLALTNSDRKFQQDSSVLDGTWRLIAVRQFDGNGKAVPISAPAQALQTLKIVANRHFSRINTTSDGRIVNTSAGIIELTADLYHEYNGFKPDTAQRQAYQWRLAGGLLTQRRTEQGRITEEIWQLID